jgi:hypothetical protein
MATELENKEITLSHIKQAAEWARDAKEAPKPIDGMTRLYRQGQWDCGTSCCMWGAASIISGNGITHDGPTAEWASQTLLHLGAAGLMNSGTSSPEQMLELLSKANLRGANLSDADLRGANLRGANLRGADLRGANLRGANLSDADLRGANLRGADLRGANLRGANLSDADLRGAMVSIGNVYRRLTQE